MAQVSRISRHSLIAFGVGVVCGCGTAPEPNRSVRETPVRATSQSISETVTADAPGYVHLFVNSKFRIGLGTTTKSEFGFDKVVGSEGVFSTDPITGWVTGIPNAMAPATLAAPLSQSEQEHNAAVTGYFVSAGLPPSQIGNVHANASMHASGSVADGTPFPPPNLTFDGYTTVISRVVGGVPVPDSFAFARFDVDGDVVEEGVYWPTIPASVIQAARTLASQVANSAQTGFLANVPGTNGHVAIRHSPSTQRTPLEAFASYDTLASGPMGGELHFDGNGDQLWLASSKPKARRSTKSPRKPPRKHIAS